MLEKIQNKFEVLSLLLFIYIYIKVFIIITLLKYFATVKNTQIVYKIWNFEDVPSTRLTNYSQKIKTITNH